jgi:hypothetical protein
LLALAVLLGGCGLAPLRPEAAQEPPLVAIRQAFERTVAAAREDPSASWQSGWVGNALINLLGGDRQGLCYEWRDLVYAGVLPTVRAVGWEATGIVMSKGTYSEHSAVLVYDPRRIAVSDLLTAGPAQPAYVLDAWRRGRADIYPLGTWVRLPLIVRSPPELKPLEEPSPTGSGHAVPALPPRTPVLRGSATRRPVGHRPTEADAAASLREAVTAPRAAFSRTGQCASRSSPGAWSSPEATTGCCVPCLGYRENAPQALLFPSPS